MKVHAVNPLNTVVETPCRSRSVSSALWKPAGPSLPNDEGGSRENDHAEVEIDASPPCTESTAGELRHLL